MATGEAPFRGKSEIDTIFKIVRSVGTPTEQTWPHFTEHLEHWKAKFPKWRPSGLQSIYRMRPDLGQLGMDLLQSLLTMNPQARMGARRAKRHDFWTQHVVQDPRMP